MKLNNDRFIHDEHYIGDRKSSFPFRAPLLLDTPHAQYTVMLDTTKRYTATPDSPCQIRVLNISYLPYCIYLFEIVHSRFYVFA